jgi:hypothetical protein
MTIRTLQLHWTLTASDWSGQICTHVQGVVERNRASVRLLYWCKFRVLRSEAQNGCLEVRLSRGRLEIFMALRATCISGACQLYGTDMLCVAGGACWRKQLARMVGGGLMAGNARFVLCMFAEAAYAYVPNEIGVTSAALRAQDEMCSRHLPAAIWRVISPHSCHAKPCQANERNP